MKKTVEDVTVRGKRVLVRLDLNVPLDSQQRITDDRRVVAALPTIRHLIEEGGRTILMSHVGRPKGEPDDAVKFSLAPVAKRLGELLGREVAFVPDCIGDATRAAAAALGDGDVCLLENLRFQDAETTKDKDAKENARLRKEKDAFASELADLGDVYVNDAFGTCHRDNASMLTVPQIMSGKPRVVGYLVQRELEFLGDALANPKKPFVCVLGGAKVSDKIGVIRSLLDKCDAILVGGAMAFSFLAAGGMDTGMSRVEPDVFPTARGLKREAGDRLKLPVDFVSAVEIEEGAETQVCTEEIPYDEMGLDIGPQSIAAFEQVIDTAKTIIWNGPLGVFETPPFDAGTLAIAQAMARATARGATTIVGGGDSAVAIDKAGLADRITHISTGGGAMLEFLEGKPFAALDVLDDR